MAVYQTDIAGFAGSFNGVPLAAPAAWAWLRHLHSPRRPDAGAPRLAIDALRAKGIPARASLGAWRGCHQVRPCRLARRSSPAMVTAGTAGRRIRRSSGAGNVERLAALAGRRDLQVVIVGDGVEKTHAAGLLPSAVFTGPLYGAELAAYASMDVFVRTGEHETFYQTVQEALASGSLIARPKAVPVTSLRPSGPECLPPSGDFEAGLSRSVDHLPGATGALFVGGSSQRGQPGLAAHLRPASRPLRRGARPSHQADSGDEERLESQSDHPGGVLYRRQNGVPGQPVIPDRAVAGIPQAEIVGAAATDHRQQKLTGPTPQGRGRLVVPAVEDDPVRAADDGPSPAVSVACRCSD